ncbi:hypothetical protein CEXT_505871 [Caerostris extrusa]|uniref:Uncharacterized protein n=1 Tax=Caerostris extrusa TaxID=172846 RepID=A0AAV4YDC5_CAEEX|nr:hypothetical protein CEXT_505871 [Caerostris extrusa]
MFYLYKSQNIKSGSNFGQHLFRKCDIALLEGTRSVDERIPRRAFTCARDSALEEQILEGLSELATHAAVYGEVDRVAEYDQKVDEEDSCVQIFVISDVPIQCVLHHVQEGGHCHGNLYDEEDCHHHYEHEGGAVAVPQLLALALPVFFEKFISLQLGLPQCREEQHVEDDQGQARSYMHEQYPESVVDSVVYVLGDGVPHPVSSHGDASLVDTAFPPEPYGLKRPVKEPRRLMDQRRSISNPWRSTPWGPCNRCGPLLGGTRKCISARPVAG